MSTFSQENYISFEVKRDISFKPKTENYSENYAPTLAKHNSKTNLESIKNRRLAKEELDVDTTWVIDSIYSYMGNGNNWTLRNCRKVLSRNRLGQYTTGMDYFWVDSINQWTKYDSIIGEYYDAKTFKERILKPWDSEAQTWRDTSNHRAKFNRDGKMLLRMSRYWDHNTNSYNGGERNVYSYNEDGNIIKEAFQDYNVDSGKWYDQRKNLYTYNNEDKLTEEIHYVTYTDSDTMVLDWKKNHTYYDDGKRKETISKSWNYKEQEWYAPSKTVYTYNNDGKQKNCLTQKWNSNTEKWVNRERTLYTYDSDGNQTEKLKQTWNKSDEKWMGEKRSMFQYNSDGNRTNGIIEIYSTDSEKWINRDTIIESYYDTDTLKEYIKRPWNSEKQTWEDTLKYEKYNENGDQVEYLDSYWKYDSNEYTMKNRRYFNYNSKGNLVREYSESWNKSIDEWVNGNRDDYYWSAFIPKYKISLSTHPTDVGSVQGDSIYKDGEEITIKATPDSGYVFGAWTSNGDTIAIDSFHTLKIAQDSSIVAHFTPSNRAKLSVSPSEGGSVSGGGAYAENKEITIDATPNEGYAFEAWTSGGDTIATENSLTFKLDQDTSLTAHFIPEYDVSLSANPTEGGTVNGAGTYLEGKNITIKAIPNDDYVFEVWIANGETIAKDNSYTFDLTQDISLTAHFIPEYTVNLSATPSEGGSISGGGTYVEGKQVTISADPDEGYKFDNWTEDGNEVSVDSVYSFTLEDDRSIVANFRQVATSIDDFGKEDIRVYPNPMNNVVNVSGLDASTNQIIIYDLRGVKVFEKDITQRNVSISVESLKKGMYFIEIKTDDGRRYVKRIIKN